MEREECVSERSMCDYEPSVFLGNQWSARSLVCYWEASVLLGGQCVTLSSVCFWELSV